MSISDTLVDVVWLGLTDDMWLHILDNS